MAVKNITSTIKTEKTIMELEQLLIRFGAKGILKEYKGTQIDSIAFYLEQNNRKIPFKLPMNLERARRVIEKAVDEKKLPSKFKQEPYRTEKAQIVGWRIIKDWIHAQISILEIEFAEPIEILLPYAYDLNKKKTFFEKIKEDKKLLPVLTDEV